MVRVFSLPPERLVYVRVLWTSVGATERAIFSLPPERLVYVRILWTSVGATGRAYSSLPLPSASITGSCRFVNTHLVVSLITLTNEQDKRVNLVHKQAQRVMNIFIVESARPATSPLPGMPHLS